MSKTGPKPAAKPQYFKDPGLDALYQMTLVLAEELAALRERLDAVVAIQQRGDLPTSDAIDSCELGEDYDRLRRDFVTRLLEPLQALGAAEDSKDSEEERRDP